MTPKNTPNNDHFVRYYQNQTLITEKNPTFDGLIFLYKNWFGRLIRPLATNKFIAYLIGRYQNSPHSRHQIADFIRRFGVDMTDALQRVDQYTCFNDFFTRKLNPGTRPIDSTPHGLVSPADSKLFVIPVLTEQTTFFVKQHTFDLKRFLGSADLAQTFAGGTLLQFRLAPADYHRFHFPASGIITYHERINGILESVNPFVFIQGYQPLTENERQVIILETEEFGPLAIIIVGATLVGSINFTYDKAAQYHTKGDEMGYFAFGGSTVVVLTQPGVLATQDIFIKHSNEGYETAVQMGQLVGAKL